MLLKLIFVVSMTVAACSAQNQVQDRYVAFVVDDTGSMGNEIEAVKLWIESCVKGSKERSGNSPCNGVNKFVLATYNDPTVGVPLGPADESEILTGVKKIVAKGGGDCPEKLYSGVNAALEVIPPMPKNSQIFNYCRVFIFTDATAKNDSKGPEAFKAAVARGCAITPFLTGCCGDCPNPCDTVSEEYCLNRGVITDKKPDESGRKKRSLDETLTGTELLYSLAESTGGTIFVMEKPATPQQMLSFLEENVSLGSCESTKIAGPRTLGYLCREDCESRGMCWDRTEKKCYCQPDKCATDRPKVKKCDGHFESKCSGMSKYSKKTRYLRDAYDCEMFYLCMRGKRYGFKCPKGKVYSKKKYSICDFPKNVKGPCGTQ